MFLTIFVRSINSSLIAQNYSGGNGSEGSPFEIATLTDLRYLSEHSDGWDKNFILTANIDASATSGWDNGAGFTPIGNNANM